MHKYAALTALAIALNITMLTHAVSASSRATSCHCYFQCYGTPGPEICNRLSFAAGARLAKLRRCKPGAFCDTLVTPPDILACIATCVAAKEAAQR
jgi:hypothetical protein